jgi:hypothetical protein
VNILDENILESQRQLLQDWRVHVRQIGYDVGRKGLKDSEIVAFLLELRRVTFFSLDDDFFDPDLCHAKYALVFLDVRKQEVALFVRRFLRHREFDTVAKRLGIVVRVSSTGITVWRLHAEDEDRFEWVDS